jgi:hypothetical protein
MFKSLTKEAEYIKNTKMERNQIILELVYENDWLS